MNTKNSTVIYYAQLGSLGRNFTRTGGDTKAWHELIETINEFRFESCNGVVIVIVDWKNTKSFIAESDYYSFNSDKIKTREDFDAMLARFEEYRRLKSVGIIKENLEIEFSIYNSSDDYSNFGYVSNVLHQIFLIMNLSIPGSCDFYSVIIRPAISNADIPKQEFRLSLSGSIIESSIQLIDQMEWPSLHEISVKKVIQWINKIGFSNSNFARSNVERTIFGMLYACIHDEIDPTNLIWLAQALESLYDTPNLGIVNILRERVFLVLGEPNANRTKIKKAINSFYDYRSRYVHGEISLPNPMSMRLLDESLNKFQDELIKHMDLAMVLIIASLQELIIKDCSGFNFLETFSMEVFE